MAAGFIDVHTHIGVDQGFFLRGYWPYAATAQDLLQHMDANDIDGAVVFPFGLPSAFDSYAFADRGAVELLPDRFPFDRENHRLVAEIEHLDPDRRLRPLAMFDPSRQVTAQVENLRMLAPKLAGLKVQGTILQSPIRALLREGRDLMLLAEERNWPVLVHTSIFAGDTWSQVDDCLEVAAAYPRARFNLAHSLRFHQRSLEQVSKLPNVWIDCAAHLIHCQLALDNHVAVALPHERVDADYSRPGQVLEAIAQIIGPRYLWGSDNPFMSWCADSICHVYSYQQEAAVLHGLPADLRQSIGATAPRAWLGEKESSATAHVQAATARKAK